MVGSAHRTTSYKYLDERESDLSQPRNMCSVYCGINAKHMSWLERRSSLLQCSLLRSLQGCKVENGATIVSMSTGNAIPLLYSCFPLNLGMLYSQVLQQGPSDEDNQSETIQGETIQGETIQSSATNAKEGTGGQ